MVYFIVCGIFYYIWYVLLYMIYFILWYTVYFIFTLLVTKSLSKYLRTEIEALKWCSSKVLKNNNYYQHTILHFLLFFKQQHRLLHCNVFTNTLQHI